MYATQATKENPQKSDQQGFVGLDVEERRKTYEVERMEEGTKLAFSSTVLIRTIRQSLKSS